MNDKKFCFISCVNNEQYYNECLHYINCINIPEGYEVEVLAIRDAKSLASAYNRAIEESDAKYKIYLHQDLFILDEDILYKILHIFGKEEVGLIGVVGSKNLSSDGVWWNSKRCYGSYYDNVAVNINEFMNPISSDKEYEEVIAIDGLIMITQYDIKWREDLFDGWHFYDISQCLEFIKRGYKIAVPRSSEPLVLHDAGLAGDDCKDTYMKYKKIFLNEYSSIIYPLVSILMPTCNNSESFRKALDTAVNQTYQNIEIIISDLSDDNKTLEIVQEYMKKYKFIRYYNKENIGDSNIEIELLKLAKGKYINYLLDNDRLKKEKIEDMMDIFINDPDLKVGLIGTKSNKIDHGNSMYQNISVIPYNSIVEGKRVVNNIVSNVNDTIGGISGALFDKSYLTLNLQEDNSYTYNSIISSILSASNTFIFSESLCDICVDK